MIVRAQSLASRYFKVPDLRLYVGLIQTHDFVVLMHVYPKCFAQALKQMLFVHLGIALHGVVFNAGCYLSQFRQRLGLQLFITVSHRLTPFSESRSRRFDTGRLKYGAASYIIISWLNRKLILTRCTTSCTSMPARRPGEKR